jgi:membrane protein required for colicin V production
MNWVDWAIIAVLTVSTLISLWRGFAREALSLLGWVAAFVLANLFADRLSDLLTQFIDNEPARYMAAFAVLFVGVLLLFNLLGVLVRQLIRLTGLSILDRLLGTVFGFTRGLIILLVVSFILRQLMPSSNQQAFNESLLMPHLDILMQWVQSTFGTMDIPSVVTNAVPKITI